MKLKELNEKTFHESTTTQIKTLNIAFNQIAHLPQNVFRNLYRVEILFLHNNRLSSLSSKVSLTDKKERAVNRMKTQMQLVKKPISKLNI